MAAVGIAEAQSSAGRAEWEDYSHTGPGTLAGRYLRTFWQPVYLAKDLPAGRAMPIRILGEDFTLYRGERPLSLTLPREGGGDPALPLPLGEGGGEGRAHAVAFRCAHRGTQLSTGWVEGDNLRCFYHGWMYDGTGQCVEQPAEPEPFCQRIRIRGYPTVEYLGLIWVYMGEGEAPPMWRFPHFEREDDGIVEVTGGTIVPTCYVNSLENDPAHVPFVHREAGHAQEIPHVISEETEYGIRDVMPNISILNRTTHRIMPHARLFRTFTAFPREIGWAEQLSWHVPVDDDTHIGLGIRKFHMTAEGRARFDELRPTRPGNPTVGTRNKTTELAAAVLRGELNVHELDRKTPNLVPLQDLVSQWGQGAIRGLDGEHLGRSDTGVILMRNVFRRELRALAEGRPLKQWTIPNRFEIPLD